MSDVSKFDELHKHLFEEGVKMRRAVLGDEYVNNALQNATPFTMPGQQLITEWAWGTVWQRPGLDRKQRSLLSKSNFRMVS
jgi:4-carboxymuconolactone decarboxylase